jgi:hypothetical protein
LRIIVLECARTVPREEVRKNEDKRRKHHKLVERTTYKQGAKRNPNSGLTYGKQQAATIQISKETDRNIWSGQVDDALVRCKKEFTKMLRRNLMNVNRK